MRNYQCRGKSYHYRAEGEADNSYRDIDNSAYHKNESDNCFIIHCKRRK